MDGRMDLGTSGARDNPKKTIALPRTNSAHKIVAEKDTLALRKKQKVTRYDCLKLHVHY